MLARELRLRRPYEIANVYKRGNFGGSSAISIKALKTNRAHNRLAIVVSRKVAKQAVVRNRIRRRLSGVIEELWSSLPASYDIVVTVRQNVSAQPVSTLRQELGQALRRALKLQKGM